MLIPRGDAVLSVCETYRAWLTRELGGTRPLVTIGVNPSTADAMEDDNTIKTEMAFARIWGCGRLIKVNPYAFRTKTPAVMIEAHARGVDIVGESISWAHVYPNHTTDKLHNDVFIQHAISEVVKHNGILLFAWGKVAGEVQKKTGKDRIAEMLAKLRTHPDWGAVKPMCIGTNLDGSPKHTLYQPHTAELVPWTQEAA